MLYQCTLKWFICTKIQGSAVNNIFTVTNFGANGKRLVVTKSQYFK